MMVGHGHYFALMLVLMYNVLTTEACECGNPAEDKWHPWSTWSICSKANNCSVGVQTRQRNFKNIFCGECSNCKLYPLSCRSQNCGELNNGCAQTCSGNNGSCSCYNGYRLDGKNCINIDECITNTHTCDQICHDEDGRYECRCRDGFFLLADGHSCRPDNCSKIHLSECPIDSYADHFGSVCQNVSYTCSKNREVESKCEFSCPEGYGLAKIQRNTGKRFGEDISSADFDNVVSSVSCAYNNGVEWSISITETLKYYCRRLHDPPKYLSLSNETINEHSPKGSTVGIISAIHYSHIVYTISVNNNDAFVINNDKLQANKVFSLKNLRNAVKSVTIRATDQMNATLYTELTFNITVININDPPQRINISKDEFNEFSPVNHVIGELSAIDYDMIDPIRTSNFDWKLLNNPEGLFKLNGSLVLLQKNIVLNKDLIYKIVVQCTDKDPMPKSSTKEIYLHSRNVNTHPEDFELRVGGTNNSLYENTAVNSTIGQIMATDRDKDIISYEIISDFKDTFSFGPVNCSHFDGSSVKCFANIVLRKELDYETKDEYEIEIKATDAKGESTIKLFDVEIADVNERPSDIIIKNNMINENSAEDTLAGTLTVQDEDEDDTHQCQIVNANTPFKLQDINILLKNGAVLDYEKNPVLNITVKCTDSGQPSLSLTKVLPIIIKDRNDELKKVEFIQTADITENSRNIIIGRIDITDEDKVTNHICSITQTSDQQMYLTIQLKDGKNVVKLLGKQLDFEKQRILQFSFVCVDMGSRNFSKGGQASLVIKDANERPQTPCMNPVYISYTTPVGVPLMKLNSKDPDNILYDEGISRFPKQRLSYILSSGDDYFKIRDNSVLTLKKKLDLNATYTYRIQVIDDGKVVLREEKNDFIYVDSTPMLQIFRCSFVAVEPNDDRLLIIQLSSSSISEKPKKADVVGEFITNKNKSIRFDIYSQDMASLAIKGKQLVVANDTAINIQQKETYNVIVSATVQATGDVVYQLFKLKVTAVCSEFSHYDTQAKRCKCMNGRVGVKCDRNPALCASSQCVNEEVCSILIANPTRCISKEYQIPVLLRTNYTFYTSGIIQYDVEETIKYFLEKPSYGNNRKRRNNGDKIYIEGSKPLAVGNSYTYVKFIPTDENSGYQLLVGKSLCSRLTNTQYRCVNKEDCEILKSFGISCPYSFDEPEATPPGKVIGGDNSTPDWMWIPIGGGALLIIVIIIVIIFVRKYKRPIKSDADIGYSVENNDLQIRNQHYMEVSKEGSPVKNNLQVNLPPATQTMKDINALRRKTDIKVFDNAIFKPNSSTPGSFEVHNPSYGTHNATNRAYIDDSQKEANKENLYTEAENMYASVGKATVNPLYDSSFKNPYDRVELPSEKANSLKDMFNEESGKKTVELSIDTKFDEDKSKSLDDVSEVVNTKPIVRGPSINHFCPEDDEKDKTFKKIDLNAEFNC